MWDVGLVNGLTIVLICIAYWHYSLLTLGYLLLGIMLLHERDKLSEDTPAITLLMAYAGLVLLLLAAFQCPVFKEGLGICTDLVSGSDITELASNSSSCLCVGCLHSWQLEQTSFQSIFGLHKYSERTSDLWIAALAFLIAMTLRGTVQSVVYMTYIVPMAEREFKTDVTDVHAQPLAEKRHEKYMATQDRTLEALGERETKERLEREQARKRLHQEHNVQARRRERARTMTPVSKVDEDAEPEPEPEPEQMMVPGLEESLEADDDEEEQEEDTEVHHMSRLHQLFSNVVEWLHKHADPLIHDTQPMLSEDDATALVAGASTSGTDRHNHNDDDEETPVVVPASPAQYGSEQRRSRTQVLTATVMRVMRAQSHLLRVARVGTAHSLVLCQAIWFAVYNHSLQLCCAFVSMGFVAHRDIISCILFITLFSYCLLSSKSITIGYWRVALRMIELRIVLVKFITAWPTECVFSTTTCEGGWPGDGPGLDVSSHQRIIDTEYGSWVWDLALLLSLLLHRQ